LLVFTDWATFSAQSGFECAVGFEMLVKTVIWGTVYKMEVGFMFKLLKGWSHIQWR